MRYPTRRLFGLTWVGWLNFLLLQWFCLRLQGRKAFEIMRSTGPDGREIKEPGAPMTIWEIRGPVAPLTGWWSSYWPREAGK